MIAVAYYIRSGLCKLAQQHCGLVHQDIYCHFEVRIYPDSPKEEVKLKWKDILGENLSRPGTVKVISALILSSIMNLSKIPSSIRLGQELGTGSHNS